ncbi:hypothetical protein N8144_05980 [Planktomarina temperata]|nr:hypothetical protein [Planktomarina temperata]
MTSFYQTFNKGIYPISKYRYLNKFLDLRTENGEHSLMCRTLNLGGKTFDQLNYVGDGGGLCDHLTFSSIMFLLKPPLDNLDDRVKNIDHWTITFNNCEKWGNCETLQYCEVTPTYQFKWKRKDRQRLIFFFNKKGKFELLNSFKQKLEIDPKTHTPICLLKNFSSKKVSDTNLIPFHKKLIN